MRAGAVLVVLLLLADAAVARQFVGQTIADVRVEVAGVPLTEPAVIELIETRIGEPLTMAQVRATIDHLVGLGRFEDVRVVAAPSAEGVIVRWLLIPVRRIGAIKIDGHAQVPGAAIRAELADRFGALPSVNRVPEMVTVLGAFYADRGFRQAAIL
ncbi:MAG: hypothetical protein Q8N52_09510, partial [Acidobacteriota bacterium]|nr:hypothetical protein [Acidobacteriota bacterium]